ncbi:putative Septin-7 [Pseudomassariella vexata]|uniref:Putative Septin-7 n=1 Tax=Pseudomassariella vexata TaxID=1141098 RepID=A0A1Y2EEA6_9PEZI|nr:putative Septin-7 [Pseudomassariella vexata]ORY69908.1 putative Septin-7 [Pseudomassariella vexata]
MMDSGSAPQLVMPSIKMPSRRPFTENGKSIGRLKILIAGDSGVGKTSLCKAIVQACEHIVHIDPIVPQARSSRRSSKRTEKSAASRRDSNSTSAITEIFASTKPYPEWWTQLNEVQANQRRKSLGDTVLERNICFVDTPGYGAGSSAIETIVPCVEYVESHLNNVSSGSLSESDMLNMLGGDGGFQVDVVFYLINHNIKPVDVEYLRRLAPLTNIIPLLAQADKLSPEELAACKVQIRCQLQDAGIRPFSFSSSRQGSSVSDPTVPYAISSADVSDRDVNLELSQMDASLLMSPDYVQPLAPSELPLLVAQAFSLNGSSWLRHSAAKKYIQWRDAVNPSQPKHLYQPLSLPGPGTMPALTGTSGALIGRPTALALARTHNRQEDTQFHLVDWAADLQRSLASERARYEGIARGERARWLTARLNECVKDGTLVPVNGSKEVSPERKRERIPKQRHSRQTMHHQDPLGLLQVAADLKAKGWVALEYIGCFGLIGGLAYFLVRDRWLEQPVRLADDWTRL